MFGKPEWFRKKTIGWGLTPITAKGWAYALIWGAVLAVPFTLLVLRHQPVEAMIWIAAAGAFLLYDVRHILIAMQPPVVATEDVMYIGDDEPSEHLATRNFDFQLRR